MCPAGTCWQGPQVTSEAFDGGWLRTGVLARTDDEGFLFIADRKEDQIITASGNNAAPTMLEDRLREHRLVGECVVVGDQRRQIAALATLDLGLRLVQAAGRLASRHVQHAVDRANAVVSRAESMRRFRILDVGFAVGAKLTRPGRSAGATSRAHTPVEIEALYA